MLNSEARRDLIAAANKAAGILDVNAVDVIADALDLLDRQAADPTAPARLGHLLLMGGNLYLALMGEQSVGDVKARAVADRILTFLSGQTERVTVSAIKAAVPGRDKVIAPALALLEHERTANKQAGPRNSQLWAATALNLPAMPF